MNIVKKVKLIIDNDNEELRKEQYNFIRDSQYAQYRGLNLAMGYLLSGYYSSNMDVKSEQFKEHFKTITNSLKIFDGINFGRGIDTKSNITQKVKKDFSTALKNGLAKGERSATNYKRTTALMTRGRDLKFSYNDKDEIIIKWVSKIKFKAVVGNTKNIELKHTLHKIISGDYKVGQSSLYFNNKNELILILTISLPDIENKNTFKVGRTLGVDLGINVPAFMSINDAPYIRRRLGSYSEFAKQKAQYKNRRERLSKQLNAVKGGKGRKDKLKALESFKEKESNFSKTYNHFLSKKIVEFALKHECEFINLEKLDNLGLDSKVLGMWCYYDLQEKIKYKSEMAGIKVRYVNAAYTSQTCSECGYVDKNNVIVDKQIFICKNCGFRAHTDYNASLNIAKSKEFIDK
ncbi:transposase [uncultured Clostridium sp.]|uniref:transposase n=1 Tax=uncultured Clostridium sp. TaxID=59620 RepID=UPI0026366B2C|nr:transposase [uncultured Clostridium sp.]